MMDPTILMNLLKSPPAQAAPSPVQPDADYLARTIYGEARGDTKAGQRAVADTIVNRLHSGRWGDTVQDVVGYPNQFSAWKASDPNRAKMEALGPEDPHYQEALKIAIQALQGHDTTGGAKHFHSLTMKSPPSWAPSMDRLADIGQHRFYR